MPPSVDECPTTAVPEPIHGDVLEAVLSHLPLIHLVPKSLVSKSFHKAVTSTLSKPCKPQPWLILHTQTSRSPYVTTTSAYDPPSRHWIHIHQPSITYVAPLRSSQSNLLYMISPSKFSFSFDPLHLTWHHVAPPSVWRIDPIVAVVGRHVIVSGGACDFEHDPLAVEIYDVSSRIWTKPEPMPEAFTGFASMTWHSVASDDRRMFVLEKNDGVLHTFDPVTNTWCGPYDLRHDRLVIHNCIGFCYNRLILIGVLGYPDDVIGVKVFEVNCESFTVCEITEMPLDLVEKLKCDELQVSSVEVRMAGNVVYIYKPVLPEEVIVCEFMNGGECNWWSVSNVVASDRCVTEQFVFTCSNVGIHDLRKATRSNVNRRFRFA
ncbi:F-box/kelch-repeat protein At1g23390-like isoform X1 [Bidens hawaiensis]|uniref:F-box/kelch-repeat protein At1g23390-like isoform X1 n=1 Tax=Bidens hawaiensis TaxID=980011 RepID=UPI00404B5FD2